MSGALQYVAHTGNLVYVGITTEKISFVHPSLHRKEINLLASRNALPADFPRIIELIESLIRQDSGVLKAIIEVTP